MLAVVSTKHALMLLIGLLGARALASAPTHGTLEATGTNPEPVDPWSGAAQQKRLEMLQSIVDRLDNHAFATGAAAVTATGVFLGFAADRGSAVLAFVAVPVVVGFGFIESYYRGRDRLYRDWYEALAETGRPRVDALVRESGTPFDHAGMGLGVPKAFKEEHRWLWLASAFHGTTFIRYLLLVLASVGLGAYYLVT